MIIAVDFDGTCVDHRYPKVGENAPYAVETLKELVARGDKLILFTMRSGERLRDAIDWFKSNGIPLFGIQTNPEQQVWTSSPKAYAQLYIDDAAFGCPMIHPEGFERKCVDWKSVAKTLLNKEYQ
jgi:hypothetical protein